MGASRDGENSSKATQQAEKVRIMVEMERLSFGEMRHFLTTNDRAR
jgi:hypothetical protein